MAHHELAPAEESNEHAPLAARAAAAGAGVEAGEPGASFGSPQSFAINPPVEAAVPTGEPFAVSTFPSGPEMASGAAAELSPTADPMSVPAVDPAFDPDRTQWVSQFATRFGVAEEASPETPAEEAEPAAAHFERTGSEQPADEHEQPASEASTTASSDEISNILSNLPGGMVSPEPSAPEAPTTQVGQRPWPLDSPGNGPEWRAEEVPVEDRDSSVSLAEEMEKAFRTADSELRVQFAEPHGETVSEPAPVERPAETLEHAISEELQPPAAIHEHATSQELQAPAAAAWENSPEPSLPPEQPAEVPAAKATAESKAPLPDPDRIAGVMQSAAMAIATRATVSAVTSQLHTSPAASAEAATGPSAIEELVGQVLERLKPKLIAEVKRELGSAEEK
jgi:hypothetical protein